VVVLDVAGPRCRAQNAITHRRHHLPLDLGGLTASATCAGARHCTCFSSATGRGPPETTGWLNRAVFFRPVYQRLDGLRMKGQDRFGLTD
jgi:hypothetical protein